jgi:hypothetical protein
MVQFVFILVCVVYINKGDMSTRSNMDPGCAKTQYKCNLCDTCVDNSISIKEHFTEPHTCTKGKQYRCSVCNSCVENSVSIGKHLADEHHAQMARTQMGACTEEAPYCAFCDMCIPSRHTTEVKNNEYLSPEHAHSLQRSHKNKVIAVGSKYCSSGSVYCEVCDSCTHCGIFSTVKKAIGLDNVRGMSTCMADSIARHEKETNHRKLVGQRRAERITYQRAKCGENCNGYHEEIGTDRIWDNK